MIVECLAAAAPIGDGTDMLLIVTLRVFASIHRLLEEQCMI